jgi:hypothetical protein
MPTVFNPVDGRQVSVGRLANDTFVFRQEMSNPGPLSALAIYPAACEKVAARTCRYRAHSTQERRESAEAASTCVSALYSTFSSLLLSWPSGQVERKGVEPSTSALRTQGHPDVSGTEQQLTATAAPVCTPVCTSEGENVHGYRGDALATLAAALLNLSPAERGRLAALLVAGNGNRHEGVGGG